MRDVSGSAMNVNACQACELSLASAASTSLASAASTSLAPAVQHQPVKHQARRQQEPDTGPFLLG